MTLEFVVPLFRPALKSCAKYGSLKPSGGCVNGSDPFVLKAMCEPKLLYYASSEYTYPPTFAETASGTV